MLSLGLNIWSASRAAAPAPAGIITANRALWLAKGGASGATWTDSSGNARHMTLTGSPTIGATSVTFSGTGQYGTVAFTIGAPMTVCMRVKQVSWTSGRYLCAGAATATNHIRQAGVSPQIEPNDSSFLHGGGPISGFSVGSTGSLVLCVTGGFGGIFSVNGTEEIIDFPTGDAAMAGFTLAAGSSAGLSPSNIEVTEVVVYSVALDASQRAQMISYMNGL